MRLGLHPNPQGAVSMSMTRRTLSQLSRGSPIPMNTVLVSTAVSSTSMNWERISAGVRSPCHPPRPVMQKRQPIRQPFWEETQRVLRSLSGIITASTPGPKGKRYFLVPSAEDMRST